MMSESTKPTPIICSHKKPQNQCRTCIMKTFLLCEKHINAPWLTKDARSVIFSHLPDEIVVPRLVGEVYEFDSKTQVRVPNNFNPMGVVLCGVEVKRAGNPFKIYCSARITKQGKSGCFTCSKHEKRFSSSVGECSRNKRISLEGVKYRMEEEHK